MSFVTGSVLFAATLGLVACSPEPADTQDPAPNASTPSEPEAPAALALVPDGTAADNQPLFDSVVATVWASADQAGGRAYIDALAGVGFDRGAMQVTQDASTVGNAAESIQFSVRWADGQCLIGQVGPSTGDPVTQIMPALAEGRCLVGTTRAIDW